MLNEDLSPFKPSGFLTLITDFGTSGPYIAVLRGVIFEQIPNAQIVDLTHEVDADWPAEAGYWITCTYSYFPKGTVHVAIVESGLSCPHHGLVVDYDGHVFVGPDNGLLASIADKPSARTYQIDVHSLRQLGVQHRSSTFQGRDIQAPLGGALAAGKISPSHTGPLTGDWAPSLLEEPTSNQAEVRGVVISIDGFGNLLTNIPKNIVMQQPAMEVLMGNKTIPLRRSYASGRPGELLALVNSFGYLEIARAQGSAASYLGVNRGAPVMIRPKYQRK